MAVFDMSRDDGGGQFPGPASHPHVRGERLCWHLFDAEVDWQWGRSYLVFGAAGEGGGDRRAQIGDTEEARDRLRAAGVDQLLGITHPSYTSLWLHAEEALEPGELEILHPSYTPAIRSLEARVFEMPLLEEDMTRGTYLGGPAVTEPSMFTFRFPRDPRFHP